MPRYRILKTIYGDGSINYQPQRRLFSLLFWEDIGLRNEYTLEGAIECIKFHRDRDIITYEVIEI